MFDGYSSGPSTKHHEHIRRRSTVAATVSISPDSVVHPNKAAFLSNCHNKSSLICLLCSRLQEVGLAVQQAASDADTLICRTAIDKAAKGENVTVVADDTDVLVLPVHHWRPCMAGVYIKHETRGSAGETTVSIAEVRNTIGGK